MCIKGYITVYTLDIYIYTMYMYIFVVFFVLYTLYVLYLSISVTHVLALVTSVLALACRHLLQCIFDLLPLNIYSWGHHPLKCFFKALANALETVAALMGDEANAFF